MVDWDQPENKIYLALDQALQTTGWAIYQNQELKEYGSFTIPANLPIERRLHEFMWELSELQYTYGDFDQIFFEDIQQQASRNVETFKKLAYVQATILVWCYNTDHKYSIYQPSHWRKIIKDKCGQTFGRSRAEQKKAAQEFVKKNFQIEVSEDEADAICIGYAALAEEKTKQSAF